MKKTIEEVKEWLLENRVDGDGDLNLAGLDFSDFYGNVFICSMKVNKNLNQSHQNVGGTLLQHHQVIGESLFQSEQDVGFDLFQGNSKVYGNLKNEKNEVAGYILENKSVQMHLVELTRDELAKMGYKLKEF